VTTHASSASEAPNSAPIDGSMRLTMALAMTVASIAGVSTDNRASYRSIARQSVADAVSGVVTWVRMAAAPDSASQSVSVRSPGWMTRSASMSACQR
jgi:hypothetical protein